MAELIVPIVRSARQVSKPSILPSHIIRLLRCHTGVIGCPAGCLHTSNLVPKTGASCPFQMHRELCLNSGRITPVSVTKFNLCCLPGFPLDALGF